MFIYCSWFKPKLVGTIAINCSNKCNKRPAVRPTKFKAATLLLQSICLLVATLGVEEFQAMRYDRDPSCGCYRRHTSAAQAALDLTQLPYWVRIVPNMGSGQGDRHLCVLKVSEPYNDVIVTGCISNQAEQNMLTDRFHVLEYNGTNKMAFVADVPGTKIINHCGSMGNREPSRYALAAANERLTLCKMECIGKECDRRELLFQLEYDDPVGPASNILQQAINGTSFRIRLMHRKRHKRNRKQTQMHYINVHNAGDVSLKPVLPSNCDERICSGYCTDPTYHGRLRNTTHHNGRGSPRRRSRNTTDQDMFRQEINEFRYGSYATMNTVVERLYRRARKISKSYQSLSISKHCLITTLRKKTLFTFQNVTSAP